MPSFRKRRDWEDPTLRVSPEHVYFGRRKFLGVAGAAGLGAMTASCLRGDAPPPAAKSAVADDPTRGAGAVAAALKVHAGKYPAKRSPRYTLDRPLTAEAIAAAYNNFYEFGNEKNLLPGYAAKLTLRPWTVQVQGLVEKPKVFDVDDLIREFPLEERLYRHRCVERWSMAVPWTGFPLRALLDRVRPLASARWVRFVSFQRPAEAIGQSRDTWYPWPYYEGLSLAEATNELTLLTTGIYGKPLAPQHGAPVRIVTPWKYGYKSIKSIVSIELTASHPPTFWNDQQPTEYGFVSNVDPTHPHPRWSQAVERMLGEDEDRPTLPFNGYGEFVASLYDGKGNLRG